MLYILYNKYKMHISNQISIISKVPIEQKSQRDEGLTPPHRKTWNFNFWKAEILLLWCTPCFCKNLSNSLERTKIWELLAWWMKVLGKGSCVILNTLSIWRCGQIAIFFNPSIIQYIPNTASPPSTHPSSSPHSPSPPEPLLLYVPSEKSRSPRDIHQTWHNNMQ